MLYVLGLIAVSIAWVLPGHYYPWTSFHQDALAAAGVALVGAGAMAGESRWPARAPVIAIALAALATVPLLQWAAGLMYFHLDAVLSAGYLVALALTIVTARHLATQDSRFELALGSIFLASGVLCFAIGLVQWAQLGPVAFVEPSAAGERVSGNLRQPNLLACLFGLAVAAAIGAFEARRIGPVGAVLAVAAFGLGIVMTQSRAGWLFAAALPVMWLMLRKRAALRTTPAALIFGVAAFTAAVPAFDALGAVASGSQAAEPLATRLQTGYRLLHWQTLWDALMQRPWFGYGWLQIPQAQLAATLDHRPTFEYINAAHNQYLDLLLWNGMPLGILIIGGLAWWAVLRLRQCADGATFALWLALAFLGVHSLVEFPLQYAYFLLPAGLIVGTIEARANAADSGVRVPRWAYFGVWSALTALLTVIVIEYFQLEESVRRARMVEARYIGARSHAFVPDIHILDGQREFVRLVLAEPRKDMTPQELDWMQAVASRQPSPGALSRLARAYALNGRPGQAERALRVLCHTAKERHCDATRALWLELAKSQPELATIAFPATPAR